MRKAPLILLVACVACSSNDDEKGESSGGTSSGGTSSGGSSSGGSSSSGSSSGGSSSGGAALGGQGQGGTPSGGASLGGQAQGGTATGGASLGGRAQGGTTTGGMASGGMALGGRAQGGTATGGQTTGGQTTGGQTTGGQTTGGQTTGGTGTGGAPPDCPAVASLGVHVVGRYDCEESGVRMSWSGTGFTGRFSGTGLSVTLDDVVNWYTVVIDGAVQEPLVTTSGEQTYPLAAGLANGEHSVEIYRRTEASSGSMLLQSIEAQGGTLLAPPDPPARRIEVIGDSITCGYGNEGADRSCGFSQDTENHYLTYGAILARGFDAELSTVAWSGKGVVSNYNGDLSEPMPTLYERAVGTEAGSQWDFGWQPQAVIINLGTNDYSTDNDPTDSDFVNGYEGLLGTIRGHYPDAFILCTVGPMLSGSDLDLARRNIEAAVARRRDAGDNDVEAYELTTGNPDPGCDWHPNLETHAAMAEELATPIAAKLGW